MTRLLPVIAMLVLLAGAYGGYEYNKRWQATERQGQQAEARQTPPPALPPEPKNASSATAPPARTPESSLTEPCESKMSKSDLPNDHPLHEFFKSYFRKCPMLGLTVSRGANTIEEGVVVKDVDSSSAAAEKGIKSGDVILEVGGLSVKDPDDVATGLSEAMKLGRKSVLVYIKSGGEARYVAVRIKKD